MIAKFRHSLKHDQFGQAIILGAACLLVLAVGVMTTAQLGWAVRERIQLQHAADNSAYSQAAMVARSLNMISWTNRAIIAQYVAAMAFQSYMGFLDVITVMVAQVAAMLLSLGFVLGVIAKIPLIGWIAEPFARVLGAVGKVIEKVADVMKSALGAIDVVIAVIVQAVPFANLITYGLLQFAAGKLLTKGMLTGTEADSSFFRRAITTTAGSETHVMSIVRTSGSSQTTSAAVLGVINDRLFSDLFDEDGSESIKMLGLPSNGLFNWLLPQKDNKQTRRAERLMTELVNASRDGTGKKGWDVQRTVGISQLISDDHEKAQRIISRLTPTSVGGSILAEAVDDSALRAMTQADAVKALKKNPLTNYNTYYTSNQRDGNDTSAGSTLPRGNALITTEYVAGLDKSFPSPLDKVAKWISKGTGEIVPMTKVVGIQATSSDDIGSRYHCKYDYVGSLGAGDLQDIIDEVCNVADICSDLKDACDDKCVYRCTGYDEEGECTGHVWEAKTGSEAGETSSNAKFCSHCDDIMTVTGNMMASRVCAELVAECKETAQEAIQGAQATAVETADEAIAAGFGGYPAKVYITCHYETRHQFSGIQRYASFNIDKFNTKQQNKSEPYPFFISMLNKQPKFLSAQNSALGFGDAYGAGKKFSMSTMSSPKGPGAADAGNCNDNMSFECKKQYNFNYISNGEMDTPFGDGFNAWATSGVYYHRPGTWVEPPNMFNPYWKAKLTPMDTTLDYLMNNGSSLNANGGSEGSILGSMFSNIFSQNGLGGGLISAILTH